nr:hypothetical protein [Bradyrhizobium sp.]
MAQPELIAQVIGRVYEYVAPGNIDLGQLGKAELHQPRAKTVSPVSLGDRKVVEKSRAPVVPAQYRSDNHASLIGRDGAETWISIQERLDRIFGVRFSKTQALRHRPELKCLADVRRSEVSDRRLKGLHLLAEQDSVFHIRLLDVQVETGALTLATAAR